MNRHDGPEDGSLPDRCLTLGLPEFGAATGSFRRIVQTPGGAADPGRTAAGTAGAQPGTAAGPQQPCVSIPVATSGGSGVTRQTVVRSCGTGSSAPVVVTTGRTYEGGDS